MGAASKGIIQRSYQHNATVYKTPYAKNPFDSVTDDELHELERKHIHGECTGTNFSKLEAKSSLQTSGAQKNSMLNAQSHSETEDVSQPQTIETKQAPKPSQRKVVLSDVDFINSEKAQTGHNISPTGRSEFPKLI